LGCVIGFLAKSSGKRQAASGKRQAASKIRMRSAADPATVFGSPILPPVAASKTRTIQHHTVFTCSLKLEA
jgi:hypothetical protein